MDLINSQYKTVEFLKEDEYGCEYIVEDLYKDNMLKRLRVIDYIPETKEFIEYMKINYYDYMNLIHPNIAEFYYFNRIRIINTRAVVSNRFYYTYEHYNGKSLFSCTKGKDMDYLLEVTRQLCAAFNYIHLRGMLFCAINEDKIHIVEDNGNIQVKISSFPYKTPIQENILLNNQSLYFKAPEVIKYSRYSKQSDIYMLGVILFHVFTGISLDGSNFKERLESYTCEPESDLYKIMNIIKKCTAINESDRYSDVIDIMDDINNTFNKNINIIDKKYIETFPLYPTSLVAREKYIKYIIDNIHKFFYENSKIRAVIISGEQGVGKEALLHALDNRIFQEDEDAIFLNLKQKSYEKYFAISEIIKKLIKYVSRELIDKYKNGLCYLIPEIIEDEEYIPIFDKDDQKEKHKIIYRLGNFILEASIKKPFVFIIKGFEFLDEESKEILYYIFGNHEKSKLFYVISFDNDIVKEEISDEIEELMGRENVTEIQLTNLSIYETANMIRLLLGVEDVPIDFIAQIYKETDGNPYMIYEIIFTLYTDKHIYVDERGHWVFDKVDLTKLKLDITPDELLQNKVKKLEPQKKRMLDIVSIFNSAVSLDVLEKMMDMKFEEISIIAESLISAKLLSRKIDDWGISVDFYSLNLKKKIYSELDHYTRYKYHSKASKILEEKFFAENRENKDELIHHMINSGRCDEAVDYLIISAEELAKKGLIKQAVQFLEQGYNYFADSNVCAKKINICFRLGDLYYKLDETEESMNYYKKALKNAEEAENNIYIADSHIRLVKLFYKLNDVKSCLQHSAKAKKIIKSIDYKQGMLDLILALSQLMIYRRKYNTHLRIVLKVLKSIDQNDKYYWAMFKSTYGRILVKKDRFEEALRHLEESAEVLEQLQEYEGLVPTLNNIGTIYYSYYYDIEKAMEYFQKNVHICQRINNLSFLSFNYNNIAEMYREKDKYKESLDYYNKALEAIIKTPNKYSETVIYTNKASVYVALEDYKKAVSCIEKAEEILSASKDIGEAILYYYVLKALFYYKMGYFQKAMSYAQKTVDMCTSLGKETDYEALYIILLCKSILYKDLNYEGLLEFAEKLFKNRKYKLGREACHSFAEMFIEQNKLEEAKVFLNLSDKYSANINTSYLNAKYEYLCAMACSGSERRNKLELLSRLDKNIESKEIKWKLFKHLGEELFKEGKYYEALRQFITSLNVLRMLVENVPDEYKIKFLLSHNRHKIKERLIKTAQEITGNISVLGITLFGGEIKDVRKAITEYFDYKHFNDIIRKEDSGLSKNSLDLNKSVMGSFVLEFLSRVNSFSQNTEENIDNLIKLLAELTQAKNSFLAIADEDNNIRFLSRQIKNENKAFYKYVIEQVRQTGESMIITDVYEYRNNVGDNIIPNDIFAVFCIPVSWSKYNHEYIGDRRRIKEPNQINGYIYLDTDTIINNFTQETYKLCELVSKILQVLIENYRLKKISGIDKLTNLYTRKYFEMVLQNEIYINSTIQGTFSLIMMDIDKFKQINDRYGHQKGDEILQKVAAIVLDTVRKSDICARYGGEEFIILLPRTDSDGAYNLAEKIRKKVENARLLGYHIPVTVSMGIATYPIHSSWMKDLIDKADQALYHSKENGRNRTTIFDINMIRTVKRVDKLAGIISGNLVEDQRNVETIIEVIELQRKHNISLEERLNEFLGKVIEISDADLGYIFILDENKNVIKEIFRQNINKKNVNIIEYNKHALYKTIETMSGEYFIDWTGNVPIDPVTGMPNWQSKMLIPFIYGDKIYAVLYLSSELKSREFDANIYNFTSRLCEIITPIFCMENK